MKIKIELDDGNVNEFDAYSLMMAAQSGDRDTNVGVVLEDEADERDLALMVSGIMHYLTTSIGAEKRDKLLRMAINATESAIRNGVSYESYMVGGNNENHD